MSEDKNWLAATPDGIVQDLSDQKSFQSRITEACQVSSFCLEEDKNFHIYKYNDNITTTTRSSVNYTDQKLYGMTLWSGLTK